MTLKTEYVVLDLLHQHSPSSFPLPIGFIEDEKNMSLHLEKEMSGAIFAIALERIDEPVANYLDTFVMQDDFDHRTSVASGLIRLSVAALEKDMVFCNLSLNQLRRSWETIKLVDAQGVLMVGQKSKFKDVDASTRLINETFTRSIYVSF